MEDFDVLPQARPGISEVLDMARELAGALSREQLWDRAAHQARRLTNADAAAWLDRVGPTYELRATTGLLPSQTVRHQTLVGLETVLFDRFGPVVVPDVTRDPSVTDAVRRRLDREGVRAVCRAPIPGHEGHVGALYVMSRSPRHFDPEDAERLAELARLLTQLVEQRTAADQLEGIAHIQADALASLMAGMDPATVVRDAGRALGVGLSLERVSGLSGPPEPTAPLRFEVAQTDLVIQGPRSLDPPAGAAVRSLAHGVALALASRRAAFTVELRLAGQLIDGLLSDTGEGLAGLSERARLLGIDLRAPRAVVALGTDEGIDRSLLDRLETCLAARVPGALLTPHVGAAVILWPVDDDTTLAGLRAEITELLNEFRSDGLVAGIGRVCHRAEEYRVSARESMFAMHMARHARPPTGLIAADDLGMHRLAAQLIPADSAREAIDNEIGPLLAADRRANSDLVRTLRTFLEHDRRTADTARALFIHANTLRYRLDQIRELLSVDLDDPNARFHVILALRLHGVFQSLTRDGDSIETRATSQAEPGRSAQRTRRIS